MKRQERIDQKNAILKTDGYKLLLFLFILYLYQHLLNLQLRNSANLFHRNSDKYKPKPRYLIEKEAREREEYDHNKQDETKKRREKKDKYKRKDFNNRDLSDDEANLPNLDDLGIKVEEKNNQIIFDVSSILFYCNLS